MAWYVPENCGASITQINITATTGRRHDHRNGNRRDGELERGMGVPEPGLDGCVFLEDDLQR